MSVSDGKEINPKQRRTGPGGSDGGAGEATVRAKKVPQWDSYHCLWLVYRGNQRGCSFLEAGWWKVTSTWNLPTCAPPAPNTVTQLHDVSWEMPVN